MSFPFGASGFGSSGIAAAQAKAVAVGAGRIVNVASDEAYTIFPTPDGKALAYRWIIGNKGDPADPPPQSVGGNYGNWRLRSIYGLPTPESSPTGQRIVFTDDIGSMDYAFLLNQPTGADLYGGIYHGFGQPWTSETIPDLLNNRNIAGFDASHQATAVWPAGEGQMTIAYSTSIDAQGVLRNVGTFVSDKPMSDSFPDMVIANGDFSQMKSGNEVAWTDISVVSNYTPTDPSDVYLRSPWTGAVIRRQHPSAPAATFVKKENGRSKIYTQHGHVTNPMGTLTSQRTVTFEQGTPDAPILAWNGATDGIAKWKVTHGSPALVSGAMEFQNGTNPQRAHWLALGILAPGDYSLPITFAYDTPGDGSWGSAYITTEGTGSTSGAIKAQSLKSLGVGNPLTFTIPDGNAVPIYLRIGIGTTGQAGKLRVSAFGPLVKVA